MRVTATAVGYDGRMLRQPGDEFSMPDGAKGSWFEPKDPPPAPVQEVAAPAATPRTRKSAQQPAPDAGADLA